MNKVIPIERGMGLAERFFSLARDMDVSPTDRSPVAAVRHVLAVLDALERGESGSEVSVNTLSFLALLRESEQRGDLCYASPEQIRGESLDERSLVFSVGVLLFERLTGRHPYGRDHERRVARIQRGEMGSGVNYFPNVPAGLRALLMRAMGPFPEERFKSLTELRARLEQFVQDHVHEAAGPRLPGTYGKSGAKKREDATRVVRMATSFGRDLMAVHQETAARPEARRLERLSELHLRAGRVGTGLDDSRAEPVEQVREPERNEPIPVMTVLPRAPVTVVSRAAMAEPTFARSGFEPMRPEPVTLTLDTVALEAAQIEARTEVSAPPSADLDLRPKRERASGLAGRLIWAGAGALAAVAIMWFATHPSSGLDAGEAPTPPAPAAAQVTESPAAQPASAPAPAVEVAAPGPAAPVVAEFSAERTGEQAIQAIGPCFPEARRARGVRFRVGVRFGGANGSVDRVYFSTAEEIDATERGCVRDHLLGLEPAAAPDTVGVVDYQIRLARNTAEVAVK